MSDDRTEQTQADMQAMVVPSDIGLARARKIVRAMCEWQFVKLGLRAGPPPDLTEHSLRALLDAAHMVRDHSDVIAPDGTKSVMVVPADRMIAGLYCLHHYEPQEPGDVEPYVEGRGRGLVVVSMVEPDSEETSA